ncbi:MAG: hypothetical protein DHS20C08_13610 [Rhodomicrobium sp.]|nr:MAG: hypothetical protein DHS20C08_13610 [Rhodomicrobium sp.]
MNWRLGLDIGSNSIGWAALELNEQNTPIRLINSGCRIFSNSRDPQAKRSLAEQRREPRGHRRNRDRYKKRRKEFMDKLVKYGLMPPDKTSRKALQNHRKGESKTIEKDPWVLRVKALDEKITLYEFGRALFHLQQRRGFKSNRKTDKAASEKGAISVAAQRTQELIAQKTARTLGEALARERAKDPKAAHLHPVRARSHTEGSKTIYEIYPLRVMIEREFHTLWDAQQQFHGRDILTEDIRKDLADTLLFQRPLKAQPIGKCTLNPGEQRAPSCLPSQQLLRIYQEVNNLRVLEPGKEARPLSLEERDKLIEKLKNTEGPKFTSLRSLISLPTHAYFNLESEKRSKLLGDVTASIMKKEECWGKEWFSLSLEKQDAIIEILNGCEPVLPNKQPNTLFQQLSENIAKILRTSTEESSELLQTISEEKITSWLQSRFNLPADNAFNIASALSQPKWPQGHGRLGRSASDKILHWLTSDNNEAPDPETGEIYKAPFIYSEAVAVAGLGSHSDLDKKTNQNRLPYYGKILERQVAFGSGDPQDNQEKQFGKIANPTVHVALNQLRKVINELAKEYGKPQQIVIETARDLPLSAEGRKDLEREQKDNQDKNEEIAGKLVEAGAANTYENRLKYRLWEELDPKDVLGRCCPFSGEQIGLEKCLFTDAIEIEHILPYAQTGDDSRANKTLATRKANRDKGNKSPYQAFGEKSQTGYVWEDILARSARLPKSKRWRFNPDAMQRFDEEGAFADRHLNDTRYINRITKTYLEALGSDVWVTPGRLTSDLRHQWGLNSVLAGHNREEAETKSANKNRDDHRHHAIDAIVVGLTDRGLLHRVARQAALGWQVGKGAVDLIKGLTPPWETFREDVREVITNLIVSHKPDHGLGGQLHNDTAYGIVEDNIDGKGLSEVVHRVSLSSLKTAEKLEQIRDEEIKAQLKAKTEGLTGKEFVEALCTAGEAMTPPVRRIRIKENLKVISINDRKTGKPYKAFKGDSNYCYEIYENENGTWTGDIIQRYRANQKDYNIKSKLSLSGAPLIMRLHNDDMIAITDPENNFETIFRIVKMSKGKITLAKHSEANVDRRDRDKEDDYNHLTISPSTLQKLKARKVRVNAIGKIFND